MRDYIPIFMGAVFILISAQTVSAKDHKAGHKAHVSHSAAYVKPGAAVTLSHDYDGITEVGEFETVTAKIGHIYQDGSLSVDLLSPEGVQISDFAPVKHAPVFSGSSLDIPIRFSGLVGGHYTVSLEIVYRDPDGHESRRVLSVPINIGGETYEKTNAAGKSEATRISKTGVIGLAAIEVIE